MGVEKNARGARTIDWGNQGADRVYQIPRLDLRSLFACVESPEQNWTMVIERRPSAFPLRMPDEVRARLRGLAEENGRSLNAELLAILEAAIEANKSRKVVPAEVLLEEVIRRVMPPSLPLATGNPTPAALAKTGRKKT